MSYQDDSQDATNVLEGNNFHKEFRLAKEDIYGTLAHTKNANFGENDR